MAESASAVIIGGGIIGLSTAYHLAWLGCPDVIVVEKEPMLVSQSTARSAGGIRLQFSSEVNIRLSWYGLDLLQRFEAETGVDPGFRQVGYLFLLDNERDVADFRAGMAVQHRLGVPSRWLTPAAVQAEFPYVDTTGVLGATFSPTDGYADPYTVAMAFGMKAREMGVRLYTDCPVTDVLVQAGRVYGVRTPRGEIHAPAVVNAAGAWAGELGRLAGVDVPVIPQRRQVFVTEPFADLPMDMPLVIDFGRWCWARREAERIIIGLSDPDEPPSFKLYTEESFMFRACATAAERLPALAEARVGRGWAGLYEISPDRNGIIGPVPELTGFYVGGGFSGHGFQQGPAVGKVIAQMMLGQEPFIDVSELSIRRFRDGWHAPEAGIV